MPDISEDFVWQFHHLKGILLGEKRKTLFKLLRKENLFVNEEQLNKAVDNLNPETCIENLLYIDTLIYFKRISELLEILKQGNEVHISKILKEPWFFKEAFKDVDAKELVNGFLPCLSFAMRMKVMKRLSVNLNETQVDALFDCILERYGLRIALNILQGCSSAKIKQVLSDNQVKLKPRQVQNLFDKNLDVFNFYLEYYKKNTGSLYYDKSVFKHIVLKNPKILMELKENIKHSSHHLGRRISKKFVDLMKVDIVKDVKYYTSVFSPSIMFRKVPSCFKNVYLDLFPREMNNIKNNHNCCKHLIYYPKNKRWDLLVETFSQVFHDKNILDNLEHLDYEFVKHCPEQEIIYKWAEIKYNATNDNNYLVYFQVNKAIPIIKQKINVTSKLYDRLNLLKMMIHCCSQNKDVDTLEDILRYICSRHRNETYNTLEQLPSCIIRDFEIENLSEVHWKYIKELIDIMRFRSNTPSNNFFYYDQCLVIRKHIEFLFKNKKPFKEEIVEYIDYFLNQHIRYSSSLLFCLENVANEKEIYIQLINTVQERVNREHKVYDNIHQQLISDIVNFSVKNREYFINILDFPYLVNYINSTLSVNVCKFYHLVYNMVLYNSQFPQNCVIENARLLEIILAESIRLNNSFNYCNLITLMVKKESRSEFENEMLQCYFEKILDTNLSHDLNFWFIKKEPLTIYPYIDKIINKCTDSSVLYSICREHLIGIKYIDLDFDAKFIEMFKRKLNSPDCDEKDKIIDYLFCIASTEDLIKVIEEQFLPEKQKIDLKDEIMRNIYKTQCHVARSLKTVIDPLKMLPVVMKFSVGDYLQSALHSLYSIFYRTPEKQLYVNTDILSNMAVSVRKHAIFLSCELLSANCATSMLLRSNDQKNVSSQKHRFSAILKYFVKNPSHELLDLLVLNMHVIDKNDEEIFKNLTSINIPRKYQVVYIEKYWQYFENMKKEGVKIADYLNSFLEAILKAPRDEVLLLLSKEFCRNVITSYFKQHEDVLPNIMRFTCNILRYRKIDQTENFNLVFEILSTHKHNKENNEIKKFFEEFYIFSSEEPDINFIKLYEKYWSNIITPIDMFYEYVLLNLLILRSESNAQNPFIENYAKNVVMFLERLVEEYNLYIYNEFKRAIIKILESNKIRENRFVFFYEILKFRATKLNCILILEIMDEVSKYDQKNVVKIYNDILQIIENVDEPVVKVYYNLKVLNDKKH